MNRYPGMEKENINSKSYKENGEWQDAETVPDNYGFPMVGYNVPGGEEASIYYNWEWLYGALEPGEYRMVWDVSRKDSGSASAQTYREYIRFRL